MQLLIYISLLALFSSPLAATEIVHRFVSPSFGGNPLNGSFLLNQATGQNGHTAPTPTTTQKSEIDRFKENLQRAILNQVSRSTTQNLFDEDGNIQLGSDLDFDLDGDGLSDFSVQVSDEAVSGNVNIRITDGITDTELIVPYLTTINTP